MVGELSPSCYSRGLNLRGDAPHDLLQAVRLVGNLRSFIEPCITISGESGMAIEAEELFDLVCEVFERTEMTYLRFEGQEHR